MFVQIITHTPIWVWALLAFLIYRGLIASTDREVSLKKLFIIPLVLLILSIQGLVNSFGANLLAPSIWLSTLVIGAIVTWQLVDVGSTTPHPNTASVFQRGSWVPMMIMMGIFLTKYAVGVSLAMHHELAQQLSFVICVSALYGIFNGILIGKLLRTLSIYRNADEPILAR